MKSINILMVIIFQALVFSSCGNNEQQPTTELGEHQERVSFTVSGMPCTRCSDKLQGILQSGTGVISAMANSNLKTNNVIIIYDKRLTTVKELKALIMSDKQFKVVES